MKKIHLILGVTIAACVSLVSFFETNDQHAARFPGKIALTNYEWTEVAPPGSGTHQYEWKKGTYPSAIVPMKGVDNKLWMIGQKKSWSSKDGIVWHEFEKHDWGERISMAPVFFNNAFWISGGMDYATNTFLNEIWTSPDGRNWSRIVTHAEWTPRKGHTVIQFKDKLWMFGGETSVDRDRAPTAFVNDVWSSSDGVYWTKMMEEAPWQKRGGPRLVVFQDKLWLVGGQDHSDIWNTSDGTSWTKVQTESPWKNRCDYGLQTFDNLLWVFGGREEDSRKAYNDVWHSADGKNWIRETPQAPWSRRSGNFSVVFEDTLFLYGGKHTGHQDGFSGDIWTMQKL